jgi:TonB family protein
MKPLLVILAALALLTPITHAQSASTLQHTLEAALKDKPLLIRDFLADPVIHYSWQTDHLAHQASHIFTFGAFEVDSVKVHDSHGTPDLVTLKGQRGVVLKPDLDEKDALSPTARPITIEVDLKGADATAIAQLPSLLFYPDIDAALGAIPPQWVQIVRIRKPGVKMSGGWNGQWVNLDGKWQIAKDRPTQLKVVHTVEPVFSEEARAKKIGGNVMVAVAFTPDGTPESTWLLQPLGLGLDEKAMQTVMQYKFAPGLMDGKPVGQVIAVSVNFQIF